MPYTELIRHTAEGLPYLAPGVVLLFKAKAARPEDEADFVAAAPRLSAGDRQWLRAGLAVTHPGHHWLSTLRAG
ncbi:MAG TPA: hypothetical protein VGH89_01075 [Pseudonocardia sp.]|jgi:hypothetical protein